MSQAELAQHQSLVHSWAQSPGHSLPKHTHPFPRDTETQTYRAPHSQTHKHLGTPSLDTQVPHSQAQRHLDSHTSGHDTGTLPRLNTHYPEDSQTTGYTHLQIQRHWDILMLVPPDPPTSWYWDTHTQILRHHPLQEFESLIPRHPSIRLLRDQSSCSPPYSALRSFHTG